MNQYDRGIEKLLTQQPAALLAVNILFFNVLIAVSQWKRKGLLGDICWNDKGCGSSMIDAIPPIFIKGIMLAASRLISMKLIEKAHLYRL